MSKLIIFGAGDIARLAYVYFTKDSPYEVAAFTVDAAFRKTDDFFGLPCVDFETLAQTFPASDYAVFVALSYAQMNTLREKKCAEAEALGYTLASYISSRCSYLSEYPAGKNCFILEDNTIQPFVRIGNNVTLWSGNHIGHDSAIEDNVFVTSHVVVSGNVRVGRNSFLGVNATIHNSVTLAPSTLVGAAAIIRKDTAEGDVWLPAGSALFHKKSSEIKM